MRPQFSPYMSDGRFVRLSQPTNRPCFQEMRPHTLCCLAQTLVTFFRQLGHGSIYDSKPGTASYQLITQQILQEALLLSSNSLR